MSNIAIIDQRHYGKCGSVKDRTKEELKNKGFSHLWNINDFNFHYEQLKRQARKQKTGLHPNWAAIEISESIINENPKVQSDLFEYKILLSSHE